MSPQKEERGLRRFYREHFPGLKTHHLIPRSRGGPTSYFVLFPWTEKSHDAWHQLLFNMTIQEVWERLDEIHAAIYSDVETVIPFWIEICTTSSADVNKKRGFEKEKSSRLSHSVSTIKLQELWLRCFESEKLMDARTQMMHMMMFMIFGPKMAEPELINQADVEALLAKTYDVKDYRRWAAGVFLTYGINAVFSRINELAP